MPSATNAPGEDDMEITNLAAAEECCKRSAASRMLPLQIMLVVGIVAIWLLCMGLI